MKSESSLRERKKAATRAALSQAAWSLMVEKGLDAVTPDAIAEAIDVSPRTFRNYFSSREEAILYGMARRAASLDEMIRARPADEPVWDSLAQVLPYAVMEFAGERDDLLVLVRAIRDNPAMLAQQLVTFERAHWLLAKTIAERTGTDVDRDVAPRLLAAVAGVAIRTSFELWAEGATDVAPADLIRESLVQLRAGLPLGATTPAA